MERATVDIYDAAGAGLGRHPRHRRSSGRGRGLRRPGDARRPPARRGLWCRALPAPPGHPGGGPRRLGGHAGRLPDRSPSALYVQGDVEHLPFARHSIGGRLVVDDPSPRPPPTGCPWPCGTCTAYLAVGSPVRDAGPRRRLRGRRPARRRGGGTRSSPAGRRTGWSTWSPGRASRSRTAPSPCRGRGAACGPSRARTLADTVGPGMRLLICGVNPSWYSADAGVGYARPGNRFWAAARAAGIVDADRDVRSALVDHGVGMTDFVKRPTRTAAEVTSRGVPDRVRPGRPPGAVAAAGGGVLHRALGVARRRRTPRRWPVLQPEGIGGRPAYVMPSTSGLNARTPAGRVGRSPAPGLVPGRRRLRRPDAPVAVGVDQPPSSCRATTSPSGSSTWELGSRLPPSTGTLTPVT